MKTTQTKPKNNSQSSGIASRAALGLGALLILGAAVFPGVAAGSTFNNVQVFVTTAASLQYSYTFTVYNTTGSLVGTYQGQYAAAAFELPAGDYLITVSAVYQYGGPCYACAQPGMADAKASPSGAYPALRYYQPTAEYGYSVQHVDSSQTINIRTQNITEFPTQQLTVKAAFVNGTAASGAWVSASVVGQWYYWWGQDSKIVMSAQTGPNGEATLVIPQAPSVVTAWEWVPVNLPSNQTTVVTYVGGQKVNVTVYWQPTYVGLSASALVIPPASGVNLTLTYQPPSYWAIPMGAASGATGPTGQGTVASMPTGVPALSQPSSAQTGSGQYAPASIPSVSQNSSRETVSPPGLSGLEMFVALALFGAVALGVLGVLFKRRPKKLSAP